MVDAQRGFDAVSRRRNSTSRHVVPERVGGIVGQLLERMGLTDKVERAAAAADWERIVGPHIARVTGKRTVRGNTLFVEVDGAVWLTELNMMRHEFLRRLNAGRRRGRIERIVFIQSGGRVTGGNGR